MQNHKGSQFEFVALMAALMSVVALAIDALLPALSQIGIEIGTTDPSDNQLLITMIFLGLGIGPLIFGPISDALGRKPIVYAGFALFIVASFICVSSENLTWIVIGRILQGIGLSAPRTISIAIIRDLYSGDYMARIMSFVTVVFLLVPIVAPALGKVILDALNWQSIFYIQVVFSVLVSYWFFKRQPETLTAENKVPFTPSLFSNGFKELLKHKSTLAYTLVSGFITGSFMVYLSGSQQIFEVHYNLKEAFPYIFAGLAIAIGAAILANSSLVLKYGMQKIAFRALIGFLSVSVLYCILFSNGENPPIEILILFFAMQFFALGFLFGNLRALAMEPVGHIAGIAAAITGFISTLMAVPISIFIGKFIATSTLPLFIGFSVSGLLSLLLFLYVKSLAKTATK